MSDLVLTISLSNPDTGVQSIYTHTIRKVEGMMGINPLIALVGIAGHAMVDKVVEKMKGEVADAYAVKQGIPTSHGIRAKLCTTSSMNALSAAGVGSPKPGL